MTDRERDKRRVSLTERIAASSRAMKAIDERIAEFKVQRAAESADRARAHAQLAVLSGELAGRKKQDLEKLCIAAGLSAAGTKADLIARLEGDGG